MVSVLTMSVVDHMFNPSFLFSYLFFDPIGGVMVSVLTTSVVDHVFNPSFLFSYLFFNPIGGVMVSVLTTSVLPLWSKKRYENKKLRLNT
jgi:hypothetical protein